MERKKERMEGKKGRREILEERKKEEYRETGEKSELERERQMWIKNE